MSLRKEDHYAADILFNGKPLPQCTKAELLRLAYQAVRFPNVNHVTFTKV